MKLGLDNAPFAFNRPRPGEYSFVVYRRIADLAEVKVERLCESDDPHKKARDAAGACKRPDAGGTEFLGGIGLVAGIPVCGGTQRVRPPAPPKAIHVLRLQN